MATKDSTKKASVSLLDGGLAFEQDFGSDLWVADGATDFSWLVSEKIVGGGLFPSYPTAGLLVEGTERDDSLLGSELNDVLHGLAGDDRLDGGWGDDLLIGGAGGDRLIGGAGYDTVSYADAAEGFEMDMNGNYAHGGEATGDTYYSIEHVIGSDHDDGIHGGPGGMLLEGRGGDDTLFASGLPGDHTDILLGGDGNDKLYSGAGTTIITGGAGADKLTLGWWTTYVTDFEQGTDKISIWGGDYDRPFGHDGILATGSEIPTTALGDRDEYFFDTDDHTLYNLLYHDDGTSSGELYMATFVNGVTLRASDFDVLFWHA